MVVKLYPHQEKAVQEMANGKILRGDPGTGKTITSLAYFYLRVCGGDDLNDPGSLKTFKDIYVITTARKRDSLDWQKDAAKLSISTTREDSAHGIKLTVDSWNNINKYQEVKDAFFIFDEQRLVGSGAWTKAFIKIAKLNEWILLSATPGDTWLDYIPVMVANGFYKNRTEFKREHVVYNTYSKFPKVDRYINTGRLVKQRNWLQVEMPYQSHTTRHIHTVPVSYDVDMFEKVVKKRWHVYEERPLRDVAELFSVMRKVVNSDTSRIEALSSLMKKHRKLIVFYNFDYELDALRDFLASGRSTRSRKSSTESPVGSLEGKSDSFPGDSISNGTPEEAISPASVATETFAYAEWNGHKHEDIPETDSWVYLVQYVAGAEAWNCVETDATVFYSLTYSYKNFEQAQGRIDRLNTPFKDLHYYILLSNSAIDNAVSKSLRSKKTFNERDFVKNHKV